jgi:hypothetical protein
MPAAKRKLATQQPNSSSNDCQQQKSAAKKRKKPPTDEIVKEEPTITTMDPTMECFARMWADEDDDDEDDDQNNVENNNKGKETPPNTSTIAMAIKRKIRFAIILENISTVTRSFVRINLFRFGMYSRMDKIDNQARKKLLSSERILEPET